MGNCGKAIESRSMPGVQEVLGSNPEDFYMPVNPCHRIDCSKASSKAFSRFGP